MQLSKHFSLDEFTISQTAVRLGLDNTPTPEHIENMKKLCSNVLETIRGSLGPVHVSSGYRSPDVNRAVGGSPTSQHCNGEAADIAVSGLTPYELAEKISKNILQFDQCILEFDRWVHISYAEGKNRKQVLTAKKINGKTTYLSGLIR